VNRNQIYNENSDVRGHETSSYSTCNAPSQYTFLRNVILKSLIIK